MLNCAIIMGRLVADPELRTTTTGLSVTSFRVAVDRSYVKPGEDRQTDFIDVVAWRQTAEFVTKYFRKGSMVAVQGSIQVRNYEDKNGNKRKAVEIVADNVSFTGSKGDTQVPTLPPKSTPSYSAPANSNCADIETDDDELPF